MVWAWGEDGQTRLGRELVRATMRSAAAILVLRRLGTGKARKLARRIGAAGVVGRHTVHFDGLDTDLRRRRRHNSSLAKLVNGQVVVVPNLDDRLGVAKPVRNGTKVGAVLADEFRKLVLLRN